MEDAVCCLVFRWSRNRAQEWVAMESCSTAAVACVALVRMCTGQLQVWSDAKSKRRRPSSTRVCAGECQTARGVQKGISALASSQRRSLIRPHDAKVGNFFHSKARRLEEG